MAKHRETVPALLLHTEDAARMLGIGRSLFYKLASEGRLPKPIMLGTAKRWRRSDIEALANGEWEPEESAASAA